MTNKAACSLRAFCGCVAACPLENFQRECGFRQVSIFSRSDPSDGLGGHKLK